MSMTMFLKWYGLHAAYRQGHCCHRKQGASIWVSMPVRQPLGGKEPGCHYLDSDRGDICAAFDETESRCHS